MAALHSVWIVLEGVKVTLRHKNVSMYSDNTPIVAWKEKWLQKYLRQKEDSSVR